MSSSNREEREEGEEREERKERQEREETRRKIDLTIGAPDNPKNEKS